MNQFALQSSSCGSMYSAFVLLLSYIALICVFCVDALIGLCFVLMFWLGCVSCTDTVINLNLCNDAVTHWPASLISILSSVLLLLYLCGFIFLNVDHMLILHDTVIQKLISMICLVILEINNWSLHTLNQCLIYRFVHLHLCLLALRPVPVMKI